MNYTTLNEQLQGRNHNRRKLANNTYAERHEDAIAIRLHDTDILTFYPDGRIVATTGGWKTHTTKDRLNQYLPGHRIWQHRGRWLLGSNGAQVEFADGMEFRPDGTIVGAKDQTAIAEEKALRKRIAKYCKQVADALPLDKPGPGDCWYCQMREVGTNKPLGECVKDRSHLESHFEEGYIVPSLVYNALEFCGCNPQGGGCAWFWRAFGDSQIGDPKDIARMVRRYLNRQFGLA